MKTEAGVSQIFDMAIRNEETGHRFYTLMAARTEDEGTKKMFELLASQELEHKRSFEYMLGELQQEANSQLDIKTFNYLQAVLKTNFFPGLEGDITLPSQAKDALAMGIQAEKDAILLYQELYNSISSPGVKKMLSVLLEEEKMHLMELREQYQEY